VAVTLRERFPILTCFEIITIGLPFCAFKMITAIYVLTYYREGAFVWAFTGTLFFLGIIDSLLNLGNLLGLLFKRRRLMPICLFTFFSEKILRHFRQSPEDHLEFGTAIDVLLSFFLVALMILDSALPRLQGWHLMLWNWSVVLNVLGAGLGRFWQAWRNLKENRQLL